MRESGRRRRLQTVLFTDIVGSTDIAAKLGDARWRALLSRHHALVRREVRRFGGREVDTAGDGFFVTFSSPADGIRCALGASEAVRELGVEIRAGLHFGEIEQMKPKVAGLAVATASRIASLARAGEVLVSSTVEELVAGSGIRFEDRGPQVLRGVPGARHVFAVTSVDGAPRPETLSSEEAERRLDAITPAPFARRHRSWIALAAIMAAGAGASIFALTRPAAPPPPVQIRPNSLVEIDPATDKVTAAVPVVEPGGSQIAVVPPRELWVLSQQNQVVSIVDSRAREKETLGIFGGQATDTAAGYGIAYAAHLVWVSGANNEVVALDPDLRTVVDRIRIPGSPNLMAVAFNRVWVAVHDAELVDAINPNTGHIVLTGHIGPGDNGIGAGEGAVWVANYLNGTISKIDPQTGKTTPIDLDYDSGPATIGVGFGSAWVSDVRKGIVERIDPATNEVVRHIKVGRPSASFASDIAALAGSMWVVSPASKSVVRIDPATNTVQARIRVPFYPAGLVAAYGKIWVTVGGTAPP
jgi:class 3 adenylate cyclase/DNA-binding beta-propeller fold protein YncE